MTDRPQGPRPETPFRLDLEQQRKRAKELHRALSAGDAEALQRYRRHHPRGGSTAEAEAAPRAPRLSDAQLVIARELGAASWPKLKAHILAMQQAREAIADARAAVDRDATTLHLRCGSDIRAALPSAGFAGDFLEYADPLCQGPVLEGADRLGCRAAFLASAYGAATGQTRAQIGERLERAEHDLRSAADRYERVVLWCEHDSYDQVMLARCLAQFAATPPRRLELISIDRFPGAVRFIGLGQLPPEALRLLWQERRPVSAQQLRFGQTIWAQLRAPDPTGLAATLRSGMSALPHLPGAIRRHCQELPWLRDGLSLTERLILQSIAERPRTIGEVFRDLTLAREPLPWLGDLMLLAVVTEMKRVTAPVLAAAFDDDDRHWSRERLRITRLGHAVLAGEVDWLSLSPPERWVGGVCIRAPSLCWRWDDQAVRPVMR